MINKKNVLFLWPPQPMFYGSVFKHITFVGETIDYVIKHTNANVKYIDAGVEMYSIKSLAESFKNNDILVIFGETYTIEMTKKMAKLAKQCNPKIRIIGFGRVFCYLKKYYLSEDCFDAIVTNGHWEKPIADFINETPAENCGQYLTKNGYIGNIYELKSEEWGIPRIDLLPIERYFELIGKRQLEICVTKGCAYNCSFCSEKYVYGKKEGRRSVESIITFVENTHELCDSYYFDATTLTYDKEWVINLCNSLLKLPYKIKWVTTTRLDKLDEEIIKIMSKAGCVRISVGLETIQKNVQKSINKDIDLNHMNYVFNLFKKYNIKPRVLLIAGLPGQTKEELIHTYQEVKKRKYDFRIKEYAPYNLVLKDGVTDELVRSFDRTEYYNDNVKIPNLNSEDYTEMIFSDTGR